MADYFELLMLPPSAALDEEVLQQAYLKATRSAHPDQVGGDAQLSTELNAALETLKSPVTRLKHLIDQHSQTAWRAIPLDDGLMGLFEKLGPLLQQSAAFLSRKEAATSALAKALLAAEEMRLREALESLNEDIETQWQQLETSLPVCDARLAENDASVWPELQAIQARFAYLAKWRAQIRERLLGLML
jgi:curved DNA-binding protein CbpA